ncbi:MAG: glutamate-cysteine ligase family protein, partial [Rugosibacter sp.]|nr:glutamate-cysteine ligase family protein [Rugosibacter sp.]
DFYWDIRPKPEFGTVEIRVCDTPLSLRMAAALAAYAQALARRLLRERAMLNAREHYLAYASNRFNACRYGLAAELIDVATGGRRPLADDVLETIDSLAEDAAVLESNAALEWLAQGIRDGQNGAVWQRQDFLAHADLSRLVRRQTGLWRQDDDMPGL